jgi:hypothetical protein
MSSLTEYEYEPVPGLPEHLPPGEVVLWQGAPRWQSMARYALHARKVALYFLALLLLHLVWELTGGKPLVDSLMASLRLAIPAALAIGLLALLAWLLSRAALYTITNRRVVMRFGAAIPIAVNLPFAQITNAALREHGDGTGDIPLTLASKVRSNYLILWPHARPWHFSPPQPMLRAVPDAAKVARILASALSTAAQTGQAGTSTGIPMDLGRTHGGGDTSAHDFATEVSPHAADSMQSPAGTTLH